MNITIPTELEIKADNVTYHVYSKSSKNKKVFQNSICYSNHVGNLENNTYHCLPNHKPSLSFDDFSKWINLGQINHLIPKDAKIENRNILILPFNEKNNYHIMYASLCMYRWSDSLPALPYTLLRILEICPKIDFFQALHYCLEKYIGNYNHSFSNIAQRKIWNTPYQNPVAQQLFLPWSMAIKHFFAPDKNGITMASYTKGVDKDRFSTGGRTAGAIIKLVTKEWELSESADFLCAKDPDDLLNEKYTKLYNLRKYNKKIMKKYWEKIS